MKIRKFNEAQTEEFDSDYNYKVYSSQLTNTTLQINIYGESWY